MQQKLIQNLYDYLKENNPDLLTALEQDGRLTAYLSDKLRSVDELLNEYQGQPEYIIEEVCMNVLTCDLRPSKFSYIRNIMDEEFTNSYRKFRESGTLQFEVINLITECQAIFDEIGFTEENEDSNDLRNAVTGTISEYLENVKSELQPATKIIR
jgi:hypothetical protein